MHTHARLNACSPYFSPSPLPSPAAVPVATGHSAGSTKFDADATMKLFRLTGVGKAGAADDDVPVTTSAPAPVGPVAVSSGLTAGAGSGAATAAAIPVRGRVAGVGWQAVLCSEIYPCALARTGSCTRDALWWGASDGSDASSRGLFFWASSPSLSPRPQAASSPVDDDWVVDHRAIEASVFGNTGTLAATLAPAPAPGPAPAPAPISASYLAPAPVPAGRTLSRQGTQH